MVALTGVAKGWARPLLSSNGTYSPKKHHYIVIFEEIIDALASGGD